MWDISFSTFSCYTPLTIEGKLDRLLWDTYFAATFPSVKTSRKGKVDASSSSGQGMKKSRKTTAQLLSAPLLSTFRFTPSTSLAMALQLHKASLTTSLPHARQQAAHRTVPSLIAARAHQNSKSASNTRLQNIMSHPTHQRAWQAASWGLKEVKLGDVTIANPRIDKPGPGTSDETLSATPSATGFVLAGSIHLFGTDKVAQLKSWHGPPPPHVIIGQDLPVYQHAEIDNIRASDFLPLLANTPFDEFEFKNIIFTYQNYDLCAIVP